MNFKKWLYNNILPAAASGFTRFLWYTVRKEITGLDMIAEASQSERTHIFCAWHGRMLLITPILSKANVIAMTSPSRDGRLQGDMLKRLGYQVVHGSSRKHPIRGLIQIIKAIEENKANGVMALDGPKGPIFEVKPGTVYMAKRTGGLIVPITYSVRHCITLNSWDRYIIPFPFTKAYISVGPVFSPSNDTSQDAIETDLQAFQRQFREQTAALDRKSGYKSQELLALIQH